MRRKTSQAVIKSARYNPINEFDEEVLRVIAAKEAEGYNFKQIAGDAILRAAGYTPEMFSNENNIVSGIASQLESLFGEFTETLLQHIAAGNIDPVQEMQRRADDLPFSESTKTFLTSFQNRHQRE